MATRSLSSGPATIDNAGYAWSGLLNGDDGAPAGSSYSGDRTVQVFGTFGTGGTVIVEGSLDGTNWFQLRDPTGTLISFTAAGGKAVMENAPYIRPRVTGGDGTTALSFLMSVRRNS
jgi:hypothetical protein